MRRRITLLLGLIALGGMAFATVRATVPFSCKAKAGATAKAAACCGQSAFPAMKIQVGDKDFTCPVEAGRFAKESKGKVVFLVSGKTYDSRDAATVAWADAADRFVGRFTSIACVADGKVIYCNDASGCSKKGFAHCAGAAAKTAAAGACCKARGAKVASTDGKPACCKAKGAKVTKVAATDGKPAHCGSKAASLAKVSGKAPGCCKAKGAKVTKVASTDGKPACCKAKAAKLAKTNGKASCCKAKGAKVTKVASTDGKPACCKAKAAKLAKTDGKPACCSKGKTAALANADGRACCKGAKDVKFLVLGRTFDTWEGAVKARDAALGEMKKVSMKYVVDGKAVASGDDVCPVAKKAGRGEFVGDQDKTHDEIMARIMLARARYEAAKVAVTKLAKL